MVSYIHPSHTTKGTVLDPYEELKQRACAIAEQLMASGKPTATFTSMDGTAVKGWRLHSFTVHPEESHWGSGWKESWGSMELLLTTEGELCIYREHHVERSDRPREDSASLEPAASSLLVGLGNGKSFSYVLEQIERLTWKS